MLDSTPDKLGYALPVPHLTGLVCQCQRHTSKLDATFECRAFRLALGRISATGRIVRRIGQDVW